MTFNGPSYYQKSHITIYLQCRLQHDFHPDFMVSLCYHRSLLHFVELMIC